MYTSRVVALATGLIIAEFETVLKQKCEYLVKDLRPDERAKVYYTNQGARSLEMAIAGQSSLRLTEAAGTTLWKNHFCAAQKCRF